jgi:hypothetical protein
MQRIDMSGPYRAPMLCSSCGQPIAWRDAYADGRGGGPWHRLCIPPKPTDFEQLLVREVTRAATNRDGISFQSEGIYAICPNS